MAKHATHTELRDAFTTHQRQTEGQVSQLEEAFAVMGLTPKAKKCAAMDGLLEEADEHMSEYHKGAGLDAALIVGAQKVEHYEIASYGSMRSIASSLGLTEAAAIFETIGEQERDTDELLTTLAESLINPDAEEAHEDTDENSGNGNTADVSDDDNTDADSDDAAGNSGAYDTEAGEDSSSAVTTTRKSKTDGATDSGYYEDVDSVEADIENDGTGRGAITSLTDGNDRGEASETGEPMGY
jgi:ferritin-like metal-binding protein YciE